MSSQNTGLQSLFTATTVGKTVMICTGTANKLQVRALPEVLARKRSLGAFRETYSLDGSDVQMTFFTATLEQVQAVLADMTPVHLTEVIAAIELANAKQAAVAAETTPENIFSTLPMCPGAQPSIRRSGRREALRHAGTSGQLPAVPSNQTRLALTTERTSTRPPFSPQTITNSNQLGLLAE